MHDKSSDIYIERPKAAHARGEVHRQPVRSRERKPPRCSCFISASTIKAKGGKKEEGVVAAAAVIVERSGAVSGHEGQEIRAKTRTLQPFAARRLRYDSSG